MPTVELDPYVVDVLMPDLIGHDRQPSAFIVFLFLWRHTYGVGQPTIQVSLLDMVTATGLSKRAIQQALSWLSKRKLLSIQRESITAVPVYTIRKLWIRR
jgi:replication protein O